MPRSSSKVDVYLEIGKKRTFAGAIGWPGWCRSGRDEGSALEALLAYGPRYERAVHGSRLGFKAPADGSAFRIVERLEGNATTDFGAPAVTPSDDRRTVGDIELRRLTTVLTACWKAFDAAVEGAKGAELRKGPRGGGRELDAIVEHVVEAEAGYLVRLAWERPKSDPSDKPVRTRQAVLNAVTSAVHRGVPAQGPRGGTRWTPRYFVRRVAWHALDHAWEIEDRATP